MNTISQIFWRGASIGVFILLCQYIYYSDMATPDDWYAWLFTFEATCVAFSSFLLLLNYLSIVLFFTSNSRA